MPVVFAFSGFPLFAIALFFPVSAAFVAFVVFAFFYCFFLRDFGFTIVRSFWFSFVFLTGIP